MSKIFTQVSVPKVRHNTFDLSHEKKFSGKIGQLIPVFLAETVPNDTFTIETSQLLRLAPLVAPVMHRFNIYTHFFYVPNRILWDDFTKFINGGNTGEETPTFPTVSLNSEINGGVGNLHDFLGIPTTQNYDPSVTVSAIPYAAYQKIWYEYYRDQNLYTGSEYDFLEENPLKNGSNNANGSVLFSLQNRAWQHDYFTSALPWTQRGPEATIPLGSQAELAGTGNLTFTNGTSSLISRNDNTTFGADDVTFNASVLNATTGLNEAALRVTGTAAGINVTDNTNLDLDPATGTYVDLSAATAASINDLRRAFRLQEWLEINARGGARYNEAIRMHFGIDPGDARLQRPEFLGGSATPIVFSEVLQTSANADQPTPQGNMAGHGVSIGGKKHTSYRCREHGFIMGIMSLMPKSAYQQGLPKYFTKFDKFDYFWKQFANIGEQPILNKEVYLDTADGEDDEIFGYTPRYAEYKYINDSVHGAFKTSLDFWHAGRKFNSRPDLTFGFVTCYPDEMDRIFAVEDTEQFYCQMYHKVKAKRPMPYFGTPTI